MEEGTQNHARGALQRARAGAPNRRSGRVSAVGDSTQHANGSCRKGACPSDVHAHAVPPVERRTRQDECRRRSVPSPSVTARILRHADRVPTPWLNGGGLTREVARSQAGDACAPGDGSGRPGPGLNWRVSVADVDRPGPFSSLPGVDRVIVLVDGSGLVLSVDGREQVLERLVPFAFSGDAVTTCGLRAGPTRDLNVMTARGRVSATVEILAVAGRRDMSADDGEELLVVAATDGLVASEPPAAALARLDALAGPGVAVEGEGTVFVVRLRALR